MSFLNSVLTFLIFIKFNLEVQAQNCSNEIESLNKAYQKTDEQPKKFLLSIEWVSIGCYLILLMLFSCSRRLRRTAHGKCWILFLTISIVSHLVEYSLMHIGFSTNWTSSFHTSEFYQWVINPELWMTRVGIFVTLYAEYYAYFWWILICCEIRFNSAGSLGRLIFYTAITSMLPLIWLKPLIDYDWEVLIRQRFISNFNFERNTEEYMKSFGFFEIVGRSVGLVIFFGAFLLSCCCKKKPVKTEDGQRPSRKVSSRLVGVFIVFTMFYPLIFVVINYYTSGPEVGLKLCSTNQILIGFNYLAPAFDVISKFNGACVVLIYVLYGFPQYQGT